MIVAGGPSAHNHRMGQKTVKTIATIAVLVIWIGVSQWSRSIEIHSDIPILQFTLDQSWRTETEEKYHGITVDWPSRLFVGKWTNRSTWQWLPEDDVEKLQATFESYREINAAYGRRLDAMLADGYARKAKGNDYLLWPWTECLFVAAAPDDTSKVRFGYENVSLEAIWQRSIRLRQGELKPSWAGQRVQQFLKDAATVDSVQLAGIGRARATTNEEQEIWHRRWNEAIRCASIVRADTFIGWDNMTEAVYPRIIETCKKALAHENRNGH